VKAPLRLYLERIGARPKRSFGLNQLDLKLVEQLSFRGGFYVEVGGNDGITQSNTAYYERYLGWKGLLVEPIPTLAEQCRRNRPRSIVEQCALVSFDFPENSIEMWYCNLMSLAKGARGTPISDERHLAAGREFLRPGDAPYSIRVPARTLTSVLDSYKVRKVDLLISRR